MDSQTSPLDPSSKPSAPVAGRKILETFKEEFEVGGRTVLIETGKIARFANGSVVIAMDETNVLSTVASAKTDGSRDFLPLTVRTLFRLEKSSDFGPIYRKKFRNFVQ